MRNVTDEIDRFDVLTTEARCKEDASFDAARVTLRDITACLRAVGAVALGIAALSREFREWERLHRSRRLRQRGSKSREEFHPDHA